MDPLRWAPRFLMSQLLEWHLHRSGLAWCFVTDWWRSVVLLTTVSDSWPCKWICFCFLFFFETRTPGCHEKSLYSDLSHPTDRLWSWPVKKAVLRWLNCSWAMEQMRGQWTARGMMLCIMPYAHKTGHCGGCCGRPWTGRAEGVKPTRFCDSKMLLDSLSIQEAS